VPNSPEPIFLSFNWIRSDLNSTSSIVSLVFESFAVSILYLITMRLDSLTVAAMLISMAVTAPGPVLRDVASSATVSSVATLDDLQQQANANTLAALDKRHEELIKRGQKSTCNSKTVAIRKE
jgi:Na+/H+ antiporter NhaB